MKEIILEENSENESINNELKKENQKKNIEDKKFHKMSGKTKKIEKEMKSIDYSKSKNKKIISLVIVILIILILLILSTIFSILNINNEDIISGIYIEGMDVSGLSKKEAMEKLEQLYGEKKKKEIGVK